MAESEFDPFSPAGTVERFDEISRGLGRRRWGKLAVWIVLALFVVLPSIPLVIYLISRR